jgi:hypothetical protein
VQWAAAGARRISRPHNRQSPSIRLRFTTRQVTFANRIKEATRPALTGNWWKRCYVGRLCSEGYEFPCYGRDYAFLTQTGLPKAFHKLMMLAMMTPSLSCEAIFCVSRVAPMHRLMREICASTRERRP